MQTFSTRSVRFVDARVDVVSMPPVAMSLALLRVLALFSGPFPRYAQLPKKLGFTLCSSEHVAKQYSVSDPRQAQPQPLIAHVTEVSDEPPPTPLVLDLLTMALSVQAWKSFTPMTASVTGPAASYVVEYCSPVFS